MDIEHQLKELGMNPNEIRVYVALTQLGEAPASIVAKKANMPRTTAISILEKFRLENLISTHRYRGVTRYWIESPRVLEQSFLQKATIAEGLGKALSDLYRSEASFPLAEIYDTKSSIRKFIERTIAHMKQRSIMYTIDTPHEGNYNKIYSETIEKTIHVMKRKRDIFTRTLIPCGSFADIPAHKLKNQNIQTREMPSGLEFSGSLWIVGLTVVHFSGNPPFAVALRHERITFGMKGMFDFLWNASRDPLK